MIVNSLKTKVMSVGKCENNTHFMVNDQKLEIANEYKYLGVVFNNTTRCF